MEDLIRYFPINVFMLWSDDIIRVWDVNVCAYELCACILAEFQQLIMNETIGEDQVLQYPLFRVGVEEMFSTFKQIVFRGPLIENLCLTDIKN